MPRNQRNVPALLNDSSAADITGQTSRYTYDGDGKRVRRQVASSTEDFQVYGFGGELLAEYRSAAATTSPQKEYGYRNGQLLVDFAGSKTIDKISVFSLHDNYTQENTPTETQTFTLYGLLAFDVQYWNGSSWVTVPGGNVTGNNKVWRKFTFAPVTTSKIRVWINTVPDAWSRVVEIQAFGTSAGDEKIQWLVADQLGSTRMVLGQSGALATVKRHDYLPFGEELFAPTGGRSAAMGYAGNAVRQQFTSKERDGETGLDYFGARYFSATQGRFTSADPLYFQMNMAVDPQRFNLYSYVRNSPLKFLDPTGEKLYLRGDMGWLLENVLYEMVGGVIRTVVPRQ